VTSSHSIATTEPRLQVAAQELIGTHASPTRSTLIKLVKSRHFLLVICILVVCSTLTLGLWPFRAPKNTVTWLAHRNGLLFGKDATVLSTRSLLRSFPSDTGASLEIWVQPSRIWDSGTMLAFCAPPKPFQFSLRQDQTDILLRALILDGRGHPTPANLRVNDVFRKPEPTFVTITWGLKGARIYIDGLLSAAAPGFPASALDFTGRLVLGDSPGQSDAWRGQLFGFAIYDRKMEAEQVLNNYAAWQRTGRPEPAWDEHNTTLYLFNEHIGRVVRDNAQSGVDLFIPPRYQVVEKIVLEPFWTEFAMTRNYWEAVFKNIVGFVPFGICFYAYLATVPVKRALLFTVVLGMAVSFTIEILQGFLPTRDSGTTDIITNTIGTWFGAVLSQQMASRLGGFLSFGRL